MSEFSKPSGEAPSSKSNQAEIDQLATQDNESFRKALEAANNAFTDADRKHIAGLAKEGVGVAEIVKAYDEAQDRAKKSAEDQVALATRNLPLSEELKAQMVEEIRTKELAERQQEAADLMLPPEIAEDSTEDKNTHLREQVKGILSMKPDEFEGFATRWLDVEEVSEASEKRAHEAKVAKDIEELHSDPAFADTSKLLGGDKPKEEKSADKPDVKEAEGESEKADEEAEPRAIGVAKVPTDSLATPEGTEKTDSEPAGGDKKEVKVETPAEEKPKEDVDGETEAEILKRREELEEVRESLKKPEGDEDATKEFKEFVEAEEKGEKPSPFSWKRVRDLWKTANAYLATKQQGLRNKKSEFYAYSEQDKNARRVVVAALIGAVGMYVAMRFGGLLDDSAEQNVPGVEATPDPDVEAPDVDAEQPPEVGGDATNGEYEFSDAAYEVESGEGFYNTMDEALNDISEADKKKLLNEIGPKLAEMKNSDGEPVAYKVGNSWGMNYGDGTMSQEALDLMRNTAIKRGYIQ